MSDSLFVCNVSNPGSDKKDVIGYKITIEKAESEGMIFKFLHLTLH